MTEIDLIQVSFYTVGPKQKKNNNNKWKNGIPCHLHTIQKYSLLKAIESHFSLLWVMQFSIISSSLGRVKVFSKKFPFFQVISIGPQEKSCLSNWFTIFHMIIEELPSLTRFFVEWTSTGYCKTSNFFFWLTFLVSSLPSLTTMRFPYSSSMNTILGESSKFPMSSISILFSSSSAITTFYERLSSLMKLWLFFLKK